jgi:predicted peptidase
MQKLILLLSLIVTMTSIKAQPPAALAAFEARTFTDEQSGHLLPYRVLWPQGYDQNKKKKYPLVLFLHGAGERGDDNLLQLTHGTPLFLDNQKQFPAIVLMPQCATDDYWAQMVKEEDQRRYNFNEFPNPSLAAVQKLLHTFMDTEKVNPDRVYLMGLSMGGMGTFELLAREPETFAAAVPICGGTNPALVALYAKQIPLWIFHGAEDGVVRVENSRRIVQQLATLGIVPRYTEYPGVNHNSWDHAFAEPGLLKWLFGERR